ncbi:hypothetical protein A2996_02090 [Candidatus Campbellbacteria bacterium RIFCSPLOWO2_01_FULL_34_15]|uniref:Uncharacterized protein n=2 Tax=Candidatus Campbelliibacteriota TaxID=1752727 RepID=A0A1F5EM79_9BACT|nr:MAG: hypothetical protein A2811_00955 [Candidatus Campbellbacteria bacterium RIFCSPHIGHO2_01_FULL_34_10]OGD68499.1 MAG: hypothetical protein A2996_02090 [Candidatus Campbellbacteria bacterium RIFCSPLOWO2_01_FULL_34_15]
MAIKKPRVLDKMIEKRIYFYKIFYDRILEARKENIKIVRMFASELPFVNSSKLFGSKIYSWTPEISRSFLREIKNIPGIKNVRYTYSLAVTPVMVIEI